MNSVIWTIKKYIKCYLRAAREKPVLLCSAPMTIIIHDNTEREKFQLVCHH